MSGEPIRLLDDGTIRDELRQQLVREGAVKPQYDVERGLARLRAAIGSAAANASSGPSSEPPSSRLSVTNYAVKGSVWRLVSVVGLAATAAIVGLRAWGPAQNVSGADEAPPAAPLPVAQAANPVAVEAPAPAAAAEGTSRIDAMFEADNLSLIQAKLQTDPAAVLPLVDAANQRFTSGTLRALREACAVDALAALGRDAEARQRGERFLKDFPDSPLATRVRVGAKL